MGNDSFADFEKLVPAIRAGLDAQLNTGTRGIRDSIIMGLLVSYFSRQEPPYKIWEGDLYGTASRKPWNEVIFNIPGAHLLSQVIDVGYQSSIHSIIKDGMETILHSGKDVGGNRVYIMYGGADNLDSELLQYFESNGYTTTIPQDNEGTNITFVFPTVGGFDTQNRMFQKVMLESIQGNYNPQVVVGIQNLLNRLGTAKNGLSIIHGPVGTGKTYLIRAILSELRNIRYGLICAPALTFLKSPDLLFRVASNYNNPIFILEDLGELFQIESKVQYPEYFSNLINITDGLMSLLNNSVFILTFNYEESHLDPAFLRHGRCLGNITVPRLSLTQARQLIGDITTIPAQKDFSLADIYALKTNSQDLSPLKESMGFRNNSNRGGVEMPASSATLRIR